MINNLNQNLNYSYNGAESTVPLSRPLIDSLSIIETFFDSKENNKLCLVLPSKEYAAQWLSTPLTLKTIASDYDEYQQLIEESVEQYKPNDRILLNNEAVLELVRKSGNKFTFKHKEYKGTDKITIELKKISKIQPAPSGRKVLSSYQKVIKALSNKSKNPIDDILGIVSEGNILYQKNSVCLVGHYKSYTDSLNEINLNKFRISEYFEPTKINEDGIACLSPLILSNSLSDLFCYLTSNKNISQIIFDGFSIIKERITDFHDIDSLDIPTILVTDLTEIDSFNLLRQFGFDIFFFSKNQINLGDSFENSPFKKFDSKLRKYVNFKMHREICTDDELSKLSAKIHNIHKDNTNNELNTISFLLVKLINHISRICYNLSAQNYSELLNEIVNVEKLYTKSKFWLGESSQLIGEIIDLLKEVVEKYKTEPSDKTNKLSNLLSTNKYDYIICRTQNEVESIKESYLDDIQRNMIKVVSYTEIDEELIFEKPVKALITGWLKSNILNQLINSLLFSEITVLFYNYENKYFNSLLNRNKNQVKHAESTLKSQNFIPDVNKKIKGFYDSILSEEELIISSEGTSEYLDFELTIENAQYSRYIVKRNSADSIKAKRVDFENDYFIFSSDTHRFLILKWITDNSRGIKYPILYKRKIDALKFGDIVAIINTDRDILIELVEKNTKKEDLEAVKEWTDLWQNLLQNYYNSIGKDFKKLVKELRKFDCTKHEATIRNWILDDSRIGPEDDSDLISIAMLTKSEKLLNNIDTVRNAIRKMTGWRMKASDFISKEIKSKIHEFADDSIVNNKIKIENLGSVNFLRVLNVSKIKEDVDNRHVNRLIRKELI